MQSTNLSEKTTTQDKDAQLVLVALPANGAHPQLQDAVAKDADGTLYGYYSGKPVADYIKTYEAEGRGTLKMMRICDFDKLHDEALRTEPEEITEAEYDEAFIVLPPMKFHNLLGVESFRMTEFYSGNITTIYAMCEGRYWKFLDNADMDTHVLVDKVHKAMKTAQAEVSA